MSEAWQPLCSKSADLRTQTGADAENMCPTKVLELALLSII